MHATKTGLALVTFLALAACQPAVPDSGAGVGFTDYETYAAQRDAELRGQAAQALPPAQTVSSETLGDTTTTGTLRTSNDPAQLAAETQAALDASAANSGQTPLQADPSNPPPSAVNSVGISKEQDFGAVGEQRSIESDKERLAQVRANYEQVQPGALPSRTSTGPNIVAYALQTTHAPGTQKYSRSGLTSQTRHQRACAKYASPDLAQTDFLKNGGPQNDRKGLDPDGDGFACTWDPRPFRTARGG
ncbi:MAG: hypothetical protein ACRBBU_10410 [Pseudooceanicola sp.]